MNWQDLKLFAAIARGGGLAPASRESGVSSPTLGRRMTELEATIGDRLFERGARGYSLTRAGELLLEHVGRMEEAASDIALLKETEQSAQQVRISAGGWTMQLLLENLSSYWSQSAVWVPEFITDYSRRSISRREIDIGIRQGRPTEPWLAGRKVGIVEYAMYRSATTPEGLDVPVWVGVGQEHPSVATGDWDSSRHGADISINVNMSVMGLPLVRQGIARMAMPCFIGDADKALVREGAVLEEFTHERWLVVHHDHRNRAHVREAIEAIAGFFTANEPQRS